jgi:hypothetical protein
VSFVLALLILKIWEAKERFSLLCFNLEQQACFVEH